MEVLEPQDVLDAPAQALKDLLEMLGRQLKMT